MEDLNYREILVKKPFYEITPKGYLQHGYYRDSVEDSSVQNMPEDTMYRKIKTQKDFLREYYPSGHSIWDEEQFPDIWKRNPDYDENGPKNASNPEWVKQKVSRSAFAFQQVIATKHTLHLTGNDVQFEIAEGSNNLGKEDTNQKLLTQFRKGWLTSDMEIRFFEAVSSWNIVAEAAIVGYFLDGKFGAKTLSFKDGDWLYPHTNSITGELELLARKYYDYDIDGLTRTEWVEVWDDTYMYRFRNDTVDEKRSTVDKVMDKIKGVFGINGYNLVSKTKHGFPFIPVAYVRNEDGPCWSVVQKTIEDYEVAFSYLCDNNKAYAFPIFYIKGDGDDISITGDDMTGAVKAIGITDPDGEAGFLNGTDASNAFATQLNKLYDLIYEMSFTVKPPELKSGDLPGVAIKLLYSPALEVAMNDAQKLHPFLHKVIEIAKFGIGVENNNMASLKALPIHGWIEPYTHQNKTEVITNLAQAVQNGFLSRQTASERCPDFPKNDEFERILREKKEEQEQDLLIDIERADNELENAIKQEEASARINGGSSGQDVNTGNGRKAGRPNRSGKEWDQNNNFLGENNWDTVKKKF